MAAKTNGVAPLKRIHLKYEYDNGDATALQLVLSLRPEWEEFKESIVFTRFTDGITNTLLKAEARRPGQSQHQVNQDAILLRAYGHGTHILIDRERECLSHSLCASRDLAPPLYARFDNGLMYKFIEGDVTSPADMRRPEVSLGIARRLAEWHARIPVSAVVESSKDEYADFTPDVPAPNLWTVLHKWISGLPTDNGHQIAKKATLAGELPWLYKLLGGVRGIGGDPTGFVFSHCDLLSGNIIMLPSETNGDSSSGIGSTNGHSSQCVAVSFIDYEYATPAPAAFDIANHFAEWGGFECDFNVIPTVQQRRDFTVAYVDSFSSFQDVTSNGEAETQNLQEQRGNQVNQLMHEIDRFRGVPGFYWGVWALIQAQISQIDFDYANYAEVRLGEYWAWKRTVAKGGADLHRGKEEQQAEQIREKRWWQAA